MSWNVYNASPCGSGNKNHGRSPCVLNDQTIKLSLRQVHDCPIVKPICDRIQNMFFVPKNYFEALEKLEEQQTPWKSSKNHTRNLYQSPCSKNIIHKSNKKSHETMCSFSKGPPKGFVTKITCSTNSHPLLSAPDGLQIARRYRYPAESGKAQTSEEDFFSSSHTFLGAQLESCSCGDGLSMV